MVELKEDEKGKPTLFSFASRHHDARQTFEAKYVEPTGLHPTLELEISSSPPLVEEEDAECRLHSHLTLPKEIFADRYQLSDPLFMASKKLSQVKHITLPVDLEAPAYAVNHWGSTVLIELAPPKSNNQDWTAQVPLHLRYLAPSNGTQGQEKIEVPYPVVFWACSPSTSPTETELRNNPFDITSLGYDSFFEEGTMFYHLTPKTTSLQSVGGKSGGGDGRLVSVVNVPVLSLEMAWYVEYGTAVVVGLGFLWVLWKPAGIFVGGGSTSRRGKVVVGKEREKKVQ